VKDDRLYLRHIHEAIVWDVVKNHLPALRDRLQKLLG
jgi:uncharacterized protein with HEPN domain